MQRAAFQRQAQLVATLDRAINPPPEPAVQYVEVSEEEGTGRLGYSDFNPKLMARPLRWW